MTTDPRLLISTGDLFEWLWPATYAASALASTWVLARALGRGLPLFAALACALAALFFPLAALPLFLSFTLLAPPRGNKSDDPGAASDAADTPTPKAGRTDELSPERDAATSDATAGEGRDGRASGQRGFHQPARRRLALASAYAALVLALGAFFFYRDCHSADAHLARAANAKLRNRRERAAAEYAAALRREDDPHTRKLFALELAAAGRHEEALAHLQAARQAAGPDESLPFHLGASLEALARPAEAAAEYRNFLDGNFCRRERPDPRCDAARARLAAAGPDAAR